MTMPVEPGGAYFGFYSDFGDVYRGEIVSYADAVASAAHASSRDVADLDVPGDIDGGTPFSTNPKFVSFTGGGSSVEILMTYDNGIWGDGEPPWTPSNFLVELQGPSVDQFVISNSGGAPFTIYHYVSADGGQSVYLASEDDLLLSAVTRIRIWRAEVFPGDPPPGPDPNFWTSFIGSHEII